MLRYNARVSITMFTTKLSIISVKQFQSNLLLTGGPKNTHAVGNKSVEYEEKFLLCSNSPSGNLRITACVTFCLSASIVTHRKGKAVINCN